MRVRLLKNVQYAPGQFGKAGDVVDVDAATVAENPRLFRDVALEAAEPPPADPPLTQQESFALQVDRLRQDDERKRAYQLEQAKKTRDAADAEYERLRKVVAELDERDRQAREQSGVIMLDERRAKLEAARAAADAQLASEKPAAEVFADAQAKATAAEAPHKRRKQG